MGKQIQFDGQVFPYDWYKGEQLKGTVECPVAYDSETEAITPYRQPLPNEDPLSIHPSPLIVPKIAVGLAYDRTHLVLIHPSRLKEFVSKHRSQQIVGQNFSFDFWVLMRYARDTNDRLLEEWLWQMGDNNKFCDTGILDLLLQLGSGKYRYAGSKGGDDAKLFMTNLAVLSSEWECGELDKTDPYRLRFSEWLNKSEEEIEQHPEFDGFAGYALKDVICTHRIYKKQRVAAIQIMRKAGWSDNPNQQTFEIRPDALRLFGPLSEFIQVKGAIVLDQLSKTPLYINQSKRSELETATRERYQKAMDRLLELEPNLFKHYSPKAKKGNASKIRLNKKSGLPQMDNGVLKNRLLKEAEQLKIVPPVSKGKKAGTSLSIKDWKHWSEQSEFLAEWYGLASEVKLLSFFLSLDTSDGKAYSNYNLLMRTGRTSAQAHKRDKILLAPSFNIQQMPRESAKHPERSVRSLFYPPPNHSWYSADYGYIELCSLASVCKARFGWSNLAEVITEHRKNGGVDPHQRTAAMIAGVSIEEFLRLDKETQKRLRQSSKAVNFGRSGGLGDDKFVSYARDQYGVTFTKAEAKEAKKRWMELYPELKLYLSDPSELAMRWQVNKSVAPKLSYLQRRRLSDYLKLSDRDRQKAKYSDDELDRFWDLLSWIAKHKNDPELMADIAERKVTGRVRNLTTYRACTLTGRVRNLVTFTAGANTPFQSAAADGGKLALWNLMRKGIHLLGFVHDSIEAAIPKGKEKSMRPIIDKVMVSSMEFVLGQNVPVSVDGAVAPNWSKA